MSFAWLFTNALAWCLLPPGNSLLLFLVAWVLRRAWPEVARLAALVGGAMLLFLSLPVVGEGLLIALEPAPLTSAELAQAQWKAGAIVVLGDGRDLVAPEYGGETVSRETLQRLRYAAWLQRQTGLPILVTGGRPDGGKEAEGRLMNRALEDDFGAWVRWEEDGARSTRENANNAAALLTRDHVGTVLLVSHGWHLPRAQAAFERAGLKAIPAPTGFTPHPHTPLDFLPQPRGLEYSRLALHEWLGRLWYLARR